MSRIHSAHAAPLLAAVSGSRDGGSRHGPRDRSPLVILCRAWPDCDVRSFSQLQPVFAAVLQPAALEELVRLPHLLPHAGRRPAQLPSHDLRHPWHSIVGGEHVDLRKASAPAQDVGHGYCVLAPAGVRHLCHDPWVAPADPVSKAFRCTPPADCRHVLGVGAVAGDQVLRDVALEAPHVPELHDLGMEGGGASKLQPVVGHVSAVPGSNQAQLHLRSGSIPGVAGANGQLGCGEPANPDGLGNGVLRHGPVRRPLATADGDELAVAHQHDVFPRYGLRRLCCRHGGWLPAQDFLGHTASGSLCSGLLGARG
mmetsp:Transcript_98835/g.288314  ORF Transcript_98835/g.288314 Transcript_98835/m.288314 type:complete len:312 (+) Transcript_98835:53-988(+)